jgi:hypothetical protein
LEVLQRQVKRQKGNEGTGYENTVTGQHETLVELTSLAINNNVEVVKALVSVVHGHAPVDAKAQKDVAKKANPNLVTALAKLGNPDMGVIRNFTPKQEFDDELTKCNLDMSEKAAARQSFADS